MWWLLTKSNAQGRHWNVCYKYFGNFWFADIVERDEGYVFTYILRQNTVIHNTNIYMSNYSYQTAP